MKIRLHSTLCLVAVALTALYGRANAQAQVDIPLPPPSPPNLPKVPDTPLSRLMQMSGEKSRVERQFLAAFDELRKHPVGDPHQFEGLFHCAIRLMGASHITGAADRVLEMLDFEIDPTTVGGIYIYPGYEFYPAAQTYAEVAEKRDIDRLFLKLKSPTNEKMLTIYGWILGEIYGQKLALLQVQKELADESARREKGSEKSITYQNNLQRLEELLKTSEHDSMILAPPKKKLDTLPQK